MNPIFEKRKSIRQFTDQPVPDRDIREIIRAATLAPSGKNVQNWHFVVVKDRPLIEAMASAVRRENERLGTLGASAEGTGRFVHMVDYHSLFDRAPCVVLVYAGDYESTGLAQNRAAGASEQSLADLDRPKPGLQNASAAMAYLQLAAADLGYGTCWMTGPLYARRAIEDLVGWHKEGYFLACITPLGVPEKWPESRPKRKPLDQVLTILHGANRR